MLGLLCFFNNLQGTQIDSDRLRIKLCLYMCTKQPLLHLRRLHVRNKILSIQNLSLATSIGKQEFIRKKIRRASQWINDQRGKSKYLFPSHYSDELVPWGKLLIVRVKDHKVIH